jgi:uncharacterized protein
MSDFPPTTRSRLKRLPNRGSYDKSVIYPILDASLICNIAFVQEKQPYVIPTLFARDDDSIIIHGASTSRLIRHLQKGHRICLSVSIIDGLVLARSIFEHSMNYRSVVVFGRGKAIFKEDEKRQALQVFSEKLLAGRWKDARQPNSVELKATGVVSVEIESATAKLRNGPPDDQPEDLSRSVWAGVIPIHTVYGEPIPAPDLAVNILFPDYLKIVTNSKINSHR